METITNALQAVLDGFTGLSSEFPLFGVWYTTVIRFVLPVLALLILLTAIRSLLAVKHLPETWAYLSLPNGERIPLTHWENIIGRAKTADVVLGYPSVSRTHAAITATTGANGRSTSLARPAARAWAANAWTATPCWRTGTCSPSAASKPCSCPSPPRKSAQNANHAPQRPVRCRLGGRSSC